MVYSCEGATVEERIKGHYGGGGLEGGGLGGGGGGGGAGGGAKKKEIQNIPHPSPNAYPFWTVDELMQKPYSNVVEWRGRDAEGRALLHVKMGEAVDTLSAEQQRKMEPVMVSQVYHGIGALCLAHDPATPRGQIGVLVDLKGLSAFKLPPLDVISNGIVALGEFFGHRAGCYYLINTPRGVGGIIRLVGLVMGGEQRRRLRVVKAKERDDILRAQASTQLGWPNAPPPPPSARDVAGAEPPSRAEPTSLAPNSSFLFDSAQDLVQSEEVHSCAA